jgi:hypothetical protein
MGIAVYMLCGITSCLCAAILARAYLRSRLKLLLWSALGFAALAINNLLLFIDMVLLGEDTSLAVIRGVASVLGIGVLLYGLIWDAA